MIGPNDTTDLDDWQRFVMTHGWRAPVSSLAHIVGQTAEAITAFRSTGVCNRQPRSKNFSELFALWHGHPPRDEDWPNPRKLGRINGYEWQEPEVALLVSLVGRLGPGEIAKILTARLRKLTGDAEAERTTVAVLLRIGSVGMQTNDVLGGITTADAGREINSLAIITHAIRTKELTFLRVGRLLVIPHAVWSEWKSKRVFPPEGFVPLRSLKEALSIHSDKLSEFARMGYVPSAIRCTPYGAKGPSSQFGVWYIDPKVAEQILADRQAGRPMPWHGKPIQDNLRTTFKLWKQRQHPVTCQTCADIWGEGGAPVTYEDYAIRYSPLAHGAKRHLTRKWNPGLTVSELALAAECTESHVRLAIGNGMLQSTLDGRQQYISLTEATRWRARKCPSGTGEKSWVSLDTACKLYLFTREDLDALISNGTLKLKVGSAGAARGIHYVSRHQCGNLREKVGFTEEEAARRVGVAVPRFRQLLEGVHWRKADGIPLSTVQAVIKRLASQEGYTVEEAASTLDTTTEWVLARKQDGTIKMTRTKWDTERVYITEPMLKRLREAQKNPAARERFNSDWLRVGDASTEAGVTATTITKWVENGELERSPSKGGWVYPREAVRARARIYWNSVRFHRATPPDWLTEEKLIAETAAAAD